MDPQELEVELGIVEYPSFPAYIQRASGLSATDLGELLFTALEAVFEKGLELTGPPTVNYLDIPADNPAHDTFSAEVAIPVDPAAATVAGLELGECPGIALAASARYRGPHAAIPQIYAALLDFIQEQQFEVIGLPREHYWERREDEQHLTELCFPVADLLPAGQRVYE